jgi:tRNA 2-thiouridine synthesizing protein A
VPEPREPTARIDARGLYCPVPILRTRDRLEGLEPGEVLEVLSDDPVILEDMPAFCRSHGHVYLGHVETSGPAWRVRLRKTGGRR